MVFVRPVTVEDLDLLVRLAGQASFGLTSLPADRELLRKRILHSRRGFESPAEEPGGEIYTFVMEDKDTKEIVGTSSIVSKVGGFEPFYAYEIKVSVHESKELHIRKEIEYLSLVTEHSGPCEIGGLFVSPDHRKHGIGRLMSLCRFLFMAEHAHLFEPLVTAEMRGVVDEQGRSPFWEALGKRFFGLDYPRADYLSMKNKKFIADLMPKDIIYVPLLSEEAQTVIGQVHEKTRPALKLLTDEGFRPNGMIDIFEGGPVVTCPLDEIRTVRTSRRVTVSEISNGDIGSKHYMIGNTSLDFRACLAPLEPLGDDGVRMPASVASVLQVAEGDQVRYAPLRGSNS